ncbi:MAG: hypothetical protein WC280_01430 [Patescibacteria group bacterium]
MSREKIIWEIDNIIKHQRSRRWYIAATIIALSFIAYAIIVNNYLFALIIILSVSLIIFYDNEEVKKINVEIKNEGISLGDKLYTFDSISVFYIIYKPEENIKKIYFEFKNPLSHRLIVPLENENPIPIRSYLLQYLEEDLDKKDEPLSDFFSNVFKI